ncbi:MAG: type II toxin-antitoxin system VapC family toxin [Burkholderiales bacterium]
MVYADSSCLVAMVAVEPRTSDVVQWLASQSEEAVLSADWCVTEVASALSIKVRTGQLSSTLADAAWNEFESACDGLLRLVSVESRDFVLAARFCRVFDAGLRAGDALHLAVALRLKCRTMWSLDRNLNLNARAHGMLTLH